MAAQILAGKLAAKGIKNLRLVDLCSSSITEAFPEVLRRSHMVLAAVTMNMGLNPVMNAFLDLCHEMDVQNRTIAIVGNSSWAPNVSGKLMMEKYKPGRNALCWENRSIFPPLLPTIIPWKNWQGS